LADLEPKFIAKVEFPFRELFDPDDPLAQWVVNASRANNDLLLANRRLMASFDSETQLGEAIYDLRAVATHAWELAKFLEDTDSLAVDAFMTRMLEEAREDWEKVQAILQDPTPIIHNKTFKATLISARDQASHYSEIDHKLLRRALTRLGENDEDGSPYLGVIYIGNTFKDSYSEFATEVDYQLFCEIKDGDVEPLKHFAAKLNEMASALIRFASTAIHVYLHGHELKMTPLND
jgi:hypothetical protein